jgi:exodeoxyribonuclease VII large subunit
MSQLSLFGLEAAVLTVTDVTRRVRALLEGDFRLQDLWVAGEVSNVSRPASGHLYFTIKDAASALRCVMWRADVARQERLPSEGEAVEVHGHVSVYEAAGQYQLYADVVRPAGEGALYQAFLRLKARLEAEGLFDPERKRPLPAWPRRVGLVTSASGAAIHDVLTVLRRRFPLGEVLLAPTPVQGEEAPASIVAALEALNRFGQPDVILLVRGGGSIEDLAAFNDEGVARAIAASKAPVVSGVGHETDFTIADFVADRRAPTPSAAAEIVSPDIVDLRATLRGLSDRLGSGFGAMLHELRWSLEERRAALGRASPRAQVENARQRLDDLLRRAEAATRHGLHLRAAAVAGLTQTLRAVGPAAVLARGYAVVTRAHDRAVVRSVRQVTDGDRLDVRVADGSFPAEAVAQAE